jgi:hypothetical protein
VKKDQKGLLVVLVLFLDHWVRRMVLVEMVLVADFDYDFDELPFVHLRIEIRVYEVRGIPSASIISLPFLSTPNELDLG